MRKFLAVLLALAMAVCMFAGCSGDTTPPADDGTTPADTTGKTFKVAYSCGQELEERWQSEIAMFQEFFEAEGGEFQYQMASYDNNKQVSQCETFLSQGVDLIIITPADADAAAVIADACKEEGVPLIVYDQPLNSPNVDYLVTFDAVETGSMITASVFEKAPKGNYVVLYGDPANVNAQNINKGVWSVIGDAVEAGDINIVLEQWVDSWDPTKALEYTENALTTTGNDIQAVITPNDGTAGGAIEALAAQGLAGQVPVSGQDADVAACQRVVEGKQTGTVYKNLLKLNKATCQLVMAVLNGESDPMSKVDSDLGTPIEFEISSGEKIPMLKIAQVFVTKDNMKQEIVDTGFHTMEEVYANIPQDQWPQ